MMDFRVLILGSWNSYYLNSSPGNILKSLKEGERARETRRRRRKRRRRKGRERRSDEGRDGKRMEQLSS